MGPLQGLKVIEMAGIGPAPFAGMMLADMGAEVVRIDRAHGTTSVVRGAANADLLGRGRRSVAVDLKHPDGPGVVLKLIEQADALIEGFRPGVMERLGLSPDVCLKRNPRLVYGRMTGWGQDGPLAQTAGHDMNYIAIAGALHMFRRAGQAPVPPVNLVGDFGGGGMLLAFGVMCAVFEASRSGKGQVIDTAMVDGAAVLTTMMHGLRAAGAWSDEPGTNIIDTGAPFYEVYETADEKHLAVGALEPQFYAELLERSGFDVERDPERLDPARWPAMKERFAALFKTKTRDEWVAIFDGSDACVAPVLSMDEAADHPHNVARGVFVERGGIRQPAPAPRFSRTQPEAGTPPRNAGAHTNETLTAWGFDNGEIARLSAAGAIMQP